MTETIRQKPHENAAARGAELFAGLQELATRHEIIGDVRGGHGLMCALELVEDRTAKTPAGKDRVARIFERTYQAGVMVRISGPNVILTPPLVLSAADVSAIVSALDEGLSA